MKSLGWEDWKRGEKAWVVTSHGPGGSKVVQECCWPQDQDCLAVNPAPSPNCWVGLGKLFNLSVPQLLLLYNGDKLPPPLV